MMDLNNVLSKIETAENRIIDSDGYDQYGYDSEGYDRDGYDSEGYDRDGYDSEGYDYDGFNKEDYDRNGYNRDGYDKEGYDEFGYDVKGHSKLFNKVIQSGKAVIKTATGHPMLSMNDYLTIQLQDSFISPLLNSKYNRLAEALRNLNFTISDCKLLLKYNTFAPSKNLESIKKISKNLGFGIYLYTKDKKSGFFLKSCCTGSTKNIFLFFGPKAMFYRYKIERKVGITVPTVFPSNKTCSSLNTTTTSDWGRIVSRYKKEIETYLKAWELANKSISPNVMSIQTGFIFQGIAGSGKSTLGIGIASLLGYSMQYIDFDKNIDEQFDRINSKTVVMMEDIDMSLGTVINDNKDRAVQRDKTTLSKLRKVMNLIDGKKKYDHVIFIATTNNLGALDSALIRPGRFNKTYEIGYFNEEEIVEMCNYYKVKPEGVIKEYGTQLTPAQLKNILEEFIAARKYYLAMKKQQYLLEKYNKED